jgi:hypothetical protein
VRDKEQLLVLFLLGPPIRAGNPDTWTRSDGFREFQFPLNPRQDDRATPSRKRSQPRASKLIATIERSFAP